MLPFPNPATRITSPVCPDSAIAAPLLSPEGDESVQLMPPEHNNNNIQKLIDSWYTIN